MGETLMNSMNMRLKFFHCMQKTEINISIQVCVSESLCLSTVQLQWLRQWWIPWFDWFLHNNYCRTGASCSQWKRGISLINKGLLMIFEFIGSYKFVYFCKWHWRLINIKVLSYMIFEFIGSNKFIVKWHWRLINMCKIFVKCCLKR